jgi:hypothetical protein
MDIKAAYQYITLHQGAMAHTHEFRNMIQAVREGSTDEKAVRQYKAEHFDFACFSGTFSYRRDEGLVAHSGLICLDFDHVGRGSALSSLRNRLIGDRYFTTQLLFTSPSGDGLKWVVDIDLSKCDHRTWFRALQNYVRATYGVATDEKCVNVSRCCFLPHDSGCYVNPITLTEPDVCPF